MWLDRVSNARALKHNGRLGTLPSAEDVPSLADLVRWSSPQPAERNHGNNVARRYSDGNSPEPSAASPVSPFGAGICLQARLRMALYKHFKLMDNSGLSPELSTCAVPGRYQRSRRRYLSGWCWAWPALAPGPRLSVNASQHMAGKFARWLAHAAA
jgi:hypothetical protein